MNIAIAALRIFNNRSDEETTLPPLAKAAVDRDSKGLRGDDPGPEEAVAAGIGWLKFAQDRSVSEDGGVARHYSLVAGWDASYPETTGYIVPTMLNASAEHEGLRRRAERMLDWLVSIQLPGGGFQGGTVESRPVVPVIFNTGQILLGLAAGVDAFGERYRAPLVEAADWLVRAQEGDGSWRAHNSPFARIGLKTYHTHVAWGLLEASRVTGDPRYSEAALANVRWALGHQHGNGWFSHCCLTDPVRPLTHTLAYALRGVLEAYEHTGDATLLDRAEATARGVLSAVDNDGHIPGRLDQNWSAAAAWSCLTGSVQIAYCWLRLYQVTGRQEYLTAGRQVNRFVRRTMSMDGSPGIKGGVQGSFPIDGEYGTFQYLNWATKFMIDANVLEAEMAGSGT